MGLGIGMAVNGDGGAEDVGRPEDRDGQRDWNADWHGGVMLFRGSKVQESGRRSSWECEGSGCAAGPQGNLSFKKERGVCVYVYIY